LSRLLVTKVLLIAVAGAAGTVARYGTTGLLRGWTERWLFPVGTLAVNVAGCLAIGYLDGLLLERWMLREEYRLAILVGFLGGYTTFSTFGLETANYLRDGQIARAATNVVLSNLLCIAAVMAGYAMSRGRA
jgi:CrcB protein